VLLLRIEIESILRGSFVSLASKGYPSRDGVWRSHHFKTLINMTPLQYQKHLRLQEARRLMLTNAMDASAAAYHVGYASRSQFSREYSRLLWSSAASGRGAGTLAASTRRIVRWI
jgi:transcriptional regulator GlxA family with amidase domain